MKINRTANLPETVSNLKAEAATQEAAADSSIRSGVAGASDSFVHSSADKPLSLANQQGPGVASGLQIQNKTGSDSVKLEPGMALNKLGQDISTGILKPGPEFQGTASSRKSYFDGKQISPQDLQKDQEYQRGKSQGGAKTHRHFTDHLMTAADLQREQDYNKGSRNPALVNSGLASSVAGKVIDAARANAALDRLASLTGKSPEELGNLLNKYGLDAGSPPNPPDDKVNAFIHDPAFASCTPQSLLQALYG